MFHHLFFPYWPINTFLKLFLQFCLILDIVICNVICFFNSLPNGEYSNLLIVATFSKSPFPEKKKSSPVKNPYS